MKMKVTWTGEAREPREWIVDRDNPEWAISYPVETETDWGWLQFLERLDVMSPKAWRALLWALRRQTEPRLAIEYVEINDWNEIGLLVMCPGCEKWVVPQGHECDYAAIVVPADDDTADVDAEAPKKAKKKRPGEPDPEA